MDNFEVLLAGVKKQGFSFYKEMNIQSDIILTNQCGENSYQEKLINNHVAKIVSTSTKGVGKNRNLGLLYAEADIILLADEDMIYYDGYMPMIKQAFLDLPNADVIFFNVDSNVENSDKYIIPKIQRINRHNYGRYGTYRIALRRSSIKRENIYFSELFGGGSLYGSGEDSLFLKDCLDKNLKLFAYPAVIGKTDDVNSCWFTGFNKKYFYDKGAYLKCVSKYLCYVYTIYFCFRLRKKSDLSMCEIFTYMKKGIQGFRNLKPYEGD